jgi:O-antigen/teichoic acid export membrane protein
MTLRAPLRGAALVMGATLAWHLSNFTFNVVAARGLSAAEYGDLAVVVALLYVITPVFLSIQTVSSRLTTHLFAAGQSAQVRPLRRHYAGRLVLGGSSLAVALALLSPDIARLLHIGSGLPLVIIAASLPLAVVMYLQRGILQGAELFGRFALSTTIEAAVKIATAIAFLAWLWPTVAGAVLGIVAGLLTALVANTALLRFLPVAERRTRPIAHHYRYSLATLTSLGLLALLLSLDVVAAKRYLPARDAGLYAAVALSGKIVFFATSGINWVVFPRFSRMVDAGEDPRPLLARALGFIAVVAALIGAAYFAVPHLFTEALFGGRYASASRYLGWIAIAYAAYSATYLGSMYLLAVRTTAGIAALGAAIVVQLLGFATLHGTVGALVSVQVAALTLAAMGVIVLCSRRARFTTTRLTAEPVPGA